MADLRFVLFDVQSDSSLFVLAENIEISATQFSESVTIVVSIEPDSVLAGQVRSLQLTLIAPSETYTQTDSKAPYSLFDDKNGDFSGVNFPEGGYQLEVGAYSLPNANGELLGVYSVNFSVIPNQPPVAVDDAFSTDEDVVLNGDALANDSDPDGDPLTAALLTDVANGSLTLSADGTFTYTPDADFNGADSFTYEVSDGQGGSATATAAITIAAVNDTPVAVDDTAAIAEDAAPNTVTGDVLANDSDVDGDPLTLTTRGDAVLSYGALTLNADGSYSYALDNSNADVDALNDGETLTDSFVYTVTDGTDEASATLAITINGVTDVIPNQPPVAVDDAFSTDVDVVLNGDALANDSDPDGDPLTLTTAATRCSATAP